MKIEPELNKWKNYICKTEWGCYKPVRINIMQRTKLEGSDKDVERNERMHHVIFPSNR